MRNDRFDNFNRQRDIPVRPGLPTWLPTARSGCATQALAPIARVTAKRAAAHLANRPSPPATVPDAVGRARVLCDRAGCGVSKNSRNGCGLAERTRAGEGRRERSLPDGSCKRIRGGPGKRHRSRDPGEHPALPKPGGVRRAPAKGETEPVPGGQASAGEFVPNEDRASPPTQAMFAYSTLATSPGGDAQPASSSFPKCESYQVALSSL
jgi:hypothetical protein